MSFGERCGTLSPSSPNVVVTLRLTRVWLRVTCSEQSTIQYTRECPSQHVSTSTQIALIGEHKLTSLALHETIAYCDANATLCSPQSTLLMTRRNRRSYIGSLPLTASRYQGPSSKAASARHECYPKRSLGGRKHGPEWHGVDHAASCIKLGVIVHLPSVSGRELGGS